jgi:hypothetical protein
VSIPGVGYDEVGSRTRQAWLRTSLNIIGVTLLAERGLMLANAPMWALLVGLLPLVSYLAVAIVRMRQVMHAESIHATSAITVAVFSAVVGVFIVGIIAVLA